MLICLNLLYKYASGKIDSEAMILLLLYLDVSKNNTNSDLKITKTLHSYT